MDKRIYHRTIKSWEKRILSKGFRATYPSIERNTGCNSVYQVYTWYMYWKNEKWNFLMCVNTLSPSDTSCTKTFVEIGLFASKKVFLEVVSTTAQKSLTVHVSNIYNMFTNHQFQTIWASVSEPCEVSTIKIAFTSVRNSGVLVGGVWCKVMEPNPFL